MSRMAFSEGYDPILQASGISGYAIEIGSAGVSNGISLATREPFVLILLRRQDLLQEKYKAYNCGV